MFQPSTGRRIYRTGDHGRLLADGQIAFLGRIDDQIKIRGFRVEADEIVAQLNAHPQIGNSIVIARGDSADEKSLVAYITPVAGAKLTANEVREHLRSRVPEYMVPSAFVSMLSLPVTATGKCDKQALPAPSLENLLPELSASAPDRQTQQSGTESRIAQLVSGLMDGRPVGREGRENRSLAFRRMLSNPSQQRRFAGFAGPDHQQKLCFPRRNDMADRDSCGLQGCGLFRHLLPRPVKQTHHGGLGL